jgi:hypothetical protein
MMKLVRADTRENRKQILEGQSHEMGDGSVLKLQNILNITLLSLCPHHINDAMRVGSF